MCTYPYTPDLTGQYMKHIPSNTVIGKADIEHLMMLIQNIVVCYRFNCDSISEIHSVYRVNVYCGDSVIGIVQRNR